MAIFPILAKSVASLDPGKRPPAPGKVVDRYWDY